MIKQESNIKFSCKHKKGEKQQKQMKKKTR